jgi:hypothetical protein
MHHYGRRRAPIPCARGHKQKLKNWIFVLTAELIPMTVQINNFSTDLAQIHRFKLF